MTDKQLSLEDIAHYPRPGRNIPDHVSFAPDSRQVFYVAGCRIRWLENCGRMTWQAGSAIVDSKNGVGGKEQQ